MMIGRPAVRLFCFFFALYALTSSGNAFRVPDEFEVYFQAEHLIDGGVIAGGMVPKIRAALSALGWEGSEAIIADSGADNALERALDDPTFGTRITASRQAVGAA